MRKEPIDAAVGALAARQYGVVSAAQLRAAGLSEAGITRRVQAGRLHRLHRGVYAVGHTSLTWEGRCLAAVLACGERAVVSHRSAAALWRMLPPPGPPVEVTLRVAGGRPDRPGIRVHTSPDLGSDAVARCGVVRATRPWRTLRDLKRAEPRSAYLRAHRRAIDLRLIEVPGAAADELTRSGLERLFLALCRRHRLPTPEVNARVAGFEVDFLWRRQRVAVETDGWEFHRDRTAFEADRARDAALQARGLRVLRFTYRTVASDPETVAATLRRVLGAR